MEATDLYIVTYRGRQVGLDNSNDAGASIFFKLEHSEGECISNEGAMKDIVSLLGDECEVFRLFKKQVPPFPQAITDWRSHLEETLRSIGALDGRDELTAEFSEEHIMQLYSSGIDPEEAAAMLQEEKE